ncbi:MAG: cellulase family glycosylhydrolase [Polyangiaceae bacterium]|nr:cellulase family glycosylhydrolase [Polyangiaceae bacterium]
MLALVTACSRRGTYLPFEKARTSAESLPSTASPPASSSAQAPRTTATIAGFSVPHAVVVSPDENGSIAVAFGTTAFARPAWALWGKDWDWAETETELRPGSEGALPTASVRNAALGLSGSVTYRRDGDRALSVVYDLRASSVRAPVIGGGLHFELTDHPAMQGKPTILPDGEGWTWAAKDGGELRVTFAPPLPRIYAEGGNPFELRCMFYVDRIEAGHRRQTMTVQAPRGAVVETRAWPPYAPLAGSWPVAFDRMTGPDLSFLNAAHGRAGSHGRLTRKGDRLVFADGTPARFWGTNLTASALFQGTDADVAALARRLAALGFNLVRLHHHDSDWVSPNIFRSGDNTKTIDATSFASLGRRVQRLKEQGIYVWIDVEVGRRYRSGDGVREFAEIARSDYRGFNFVNPDLEAAWRDFARQYLSTKNPSTGLSFAEDPGVVAVLLTNENDLTQHFGNKMLRDKPSPAHTAMFEAMASQFAASSGHPLDRLLRTWEPGPSKLWLNELEHRFFTRSLDYVRKLGVKALVAPTSTWGNPTFSLPSLTSGDIIDVHNYGKSEFLSRDPRSNPTFAHWLAAAQVAGYPLSVTEWSVTWPAKDRFAAPLYVASLASLQGWDLVMHYAYQQYSAGGTPTTLDIWSAADDPALMTQMPAAALLFRRGDVAEAKRTFRLELDAASLYDREVSPATSAAIRTLAEQSRLVIGLPDTHELAWDTFTKPTGQEVITDPDRSFLPPAATRVASDTGQLVRDWTEGYQLIDTPRSQAVSGWLGGRTVKLGAATISVTTGKATVVVSSLDERPIATAQSLLVTATAQATSSGALPLRSEPVVGSLRLVTECRCARRLRPGPAAKAVALPVDGGAVVLAFGPDDFSHWHLLERPRGGGSGACN